MNKQITSVIWALNKSVFYWSYSAIQTTSVFHPDHRSATNTMLDPSQMPARILTRPGIPPPPIPSKEQLEWLKSLPPPPSHPPPPPPPTPCHTGLKPNFTPKERERLRRVVYENDPESVAVCEEGLVPITHDDHSQPPTVDWDEASSESSSETVIFGDKDEKFRDYAPSTHRSDAKPVSSASISPGDASGKETATSTRRNHLW
jgi:hypothetical protein